MIEASRLSPGARPTDAAAAAAARAVWCRAVTTVPIGRARRGEREGDRPAWSRRGVERVHAATGAAGGRPPSSEPAQARGELVLQRLRCSASRSRSRSTTSAGARSAKSGRASLPSQEGDLLGAPARSPCRAAGARRRGPPRPSRSHVDLGARPATPSAEARGRVAAGSTVTRGAGQRARSARRCARARPRAVGRRAACTVTVSSAAGEIRHLAADGADGADDVDHAGSIARSASGIAAPASAAVGNGAIMIDSPVVGQPLPDAPR